MAIRIPKYSDSGGNVALPTRRISANLNPSAMAAPGRALAQAGQGMTNLGQSIFKVEADQQEKKNRMWLVSKSTELETEMTQKAEELKLNQQPDDYISDESFINGTNPNTYTNQMNTKFDNIVSESMDKSGKNKKYDAPNEATAMKWQEQKDKIKANFAISAIKHEASLRSAAYLDKLDDALSTMNQEVFDNPGLIDMHLNRINILTDGLDDKETTKIEGYGNLIKASDLIGVNKAAAANLVENSFRGLIVNEPLRSYMILNGNIKGKAAGKFGGLAGKYLTPQKVEQLKNLAKQNILIDNRDAMKKIGIAHADNITALLNGGEANSPDLITKNGIREGVYQTFGYDAQEMEVIFKIFPNLKNQTEDLISTMESDVRVGVLTSKFTQDHQTKTDAEIIADVNNFADAAKRSPSEVKTYFGKQDLDAYDKTLMGEISLTEYVDAANKISTTMANTLKARSTDFAAYSKTIDKIQSLPEGSVEQKAAILSYGESLGLSNINVLTNSEAEKIVAGAKGIKNGEQASAWYANWTATLGDNPETLQVENSKIIDQAWRQLTTMEGGLGVEWQVMSLFKDTPGGMVLGSAAISDQTDLVNQLKAINPGFKIADLETAMFGNSDLKNITTILTGDVFGRGEAAEQIYKMMQNAVMIDMIQNKKTMGQSVTNVGRMLNNTGIEFVHKQNEYSFYVRPGETDATGTQVNATVVAFNLEAISSDKANMVQFLQDKGIVIPGSLDGIVEADVEFKEQFFANFLIEHGQFVMNDNGNGVMFTYPALFGSNAAAQGSGFNVPLLVMQDGKAEPFEIPFSELNKFKPDTKFIGNTGKAIIGTDEYKATESNP